MRKIGPRWRWLAAAGVLLVAAVALTSVTRTAKAADESTAWLGVYTQDLSAGLREGLDYEGSGVLVNRVIDGSPADKAGIRQGDVIIRFNNRQVDSASDLVDLVQASRVGQRVAIQISRDGSRQTINVRLGDRSDSEGSSPDTWTWQRGDEDNDQVAPHVYRYKSKDDDGEDEDEVMPHVFRFRSDADSDRDFVLDLPSHGDLVRIGLGRGRLGVQVQDLNEGLSEYFDTKSGALVMDVVKDSPAEKAGIKAGDVITRFDGKTIEDSDDLIRAVRSADEGPVDVTVIRKGRTQTFRPELEKQGMMWLGRDMTPEQRRELRRMTDRVRENADRIRVRTERLRDHADRMRQRAERMKDSDIRREVQRLKQELRDLERRLGETNQDED